MKPACRTVAPTFLQYREILARYIKSRVMDHLECEELLSEVMMKIYNHCEKLSDIRNTEAWLIAIAKNTVTDFFRERQKVSYDLPQFQDFEEEHFIQQLEPCVTSLIDKLPEKYAMPLRAYELEGISQKSLAAQYNMSESGLKSRVQRGRKMLKELFTSYCGKMALLSEACPNCDCK